MLGRDFCTGMNAFVLNITLSEKIECKFGRTSQCRHWGQDCLYSAGQCQYPCVCPLPKFPKTPSWDGLIKNHWNTKQDSPSWSEDGSWGMK